MVNILKSFPKVFKRNPTGELKYVSGALNYALNNMDSDLRRLDNQYNILTSDGEWLLEWGSWIGIQKNDNESDEMYRSRVLATATTPKNTIPAIKSAVMSYINGAGGKVEEVSVDIVEPYSLETDPLSPLYPLGYYNHAVIDIVITNGPITQGLVSSIKKVRAAGIKEFYTRVTTGNRPVDVSESAISFSDMSLCKEFTVVDSDENLLAGSDTVIQDVLGSVILNTISNIILDLELIDMVPLEGQDHTEYLKIDTHYYV